MSFYGNDVLRGVLGDCVRIGEEVGLMDDVLDLLGDDSGEVSFGDLYYYVMGRYGVLSLDGIGSMYFEMGEFSRVRNGIWVVLGDFESGTGEIDVDRLVLKLGLWRDELLDIRDGYLERMGVTMEDVEEFSRRGSMFSGYGSY